MDCASPDQTEPTGLFLMPATTLPHCYSTRVVDLDSVSTRSHAFVLLQCRQRTSWPAHSSSAALHSTERNALNYPENKYKR